MRQMQYKNSYAAAILELLDIFIKWLKDLLHII